MRIVSLFILVFSLSSCEKKSPEINIGPIEKGQAVLVNIGENPVFIYAASEKDEYNLDLLSKYTAHDTNIERYKIAPYYVLEARAPGGGCILKFYPADDENWFGGFVDPCKDTNYDVIGRVISEAKYTINNYPAKKSSLRSYRYVINNNGSLKIWPK